MAVVHLTVHGDALDLICLRHYGRHFGVVEKVLDANPDIAGCAHSLPTGLEIVLPDVVASVDGQQAVKLWD